MGMGQKLKPWSTMQDTTRWVSWCHDPQPHAQTGRVWDKMGNADELIAPELIKVGEELPIFFMHSEVVWRGCESWSVGTCAE